MKHLSWWKILSIFITIYVITAGLLIPLKPGISDISAVRLESGTDRELTITGYNTRFTEQNSAFFIRIDSAHSIRCQSIKVLSDTEARLLFNIPNTLPNNREYQDATLIMVTKPDNLISVLPVLRIVIHNNRSLEVSSLQGWPNELEIGETSWRFNFPYRNTLLESIRNLFFHVAIWMAMFALLLIALFHSIRYLQTQNEKYDHTASSFTFVAILFGAIGLITGSIWAKATWGTYWTNDVKLNMTAISFMIYLSYGLLRGSMNDYDKKARLSAVYNIFAFIAMIPLIWILPRLSDSLHPGNGGNPAFGGEDLDNTLRLVFYPAVVALFLIGTWISTIQIRLKNIQQSLIDSELKIK